MRNLSTWTNLQYGWNWPFLQTRARQNLSHKETCWTQKDKERLTVALCANADGSHKLDPLIISKLSDKVMAKKNVHHMIIEAADARVGICSPDSRSQQQIRSITYKVSKCAQRLIIVIFTSSSLNWDCCLSLYSLYYKIICYAN